MQLKVLFFQLPYPRYSPGSSSLLQYLKGTGSFDLSCTESLNEFESFSQYDVVVLGSSFIPQPGQGRALVDFVRRGGGLVCIGESTDNWYQNENLTSSFALAGKDRTPRTELIIRVPASSDHPMTRRLYAGYAHDHYAGLDLDTAFTLYDSFIPDQSLPSENREDRQILLQVSWLGKRLPAAWLQKIGQGYFFQTSLGQNPDSLANPVFQQLVFRAINYTGGEKEAPPVRVAMLGYGAIGYEHGTAVSQVPGLEFSLVCDRNESRLSEARSAFSSVRTTTDFRQIETDPEVDLVIISTPPDSHAPLALRMLEAGKHVVVEKPFALNLQQAREMVGKAREVNRTLTVYQCRRWDADFLAIKHAAASSAIGEIFHLETFIGSFNHPCDYWHSQEEVSGGVFFDWGSHYLDWVLGLLPGKVKSVSGYSHKRVWHDVSNEDQARVIMRFEGGQEAEFMHSDIAAALKPKWYILGTGGAILGQWREETVKTRRWSGDLIEERLMPSEALPTLTLFQRTAFGTTNEQKIALPPSPVFPFHRNLANHLLNGEPLAVLPEEACRNIAVMEAAKRSARQGGQFVPVED